MPLLIVNKSLDSVVKLKVFNGGEPLPLSLITRMHLVFLGSDIDADTEYDSTLITWNDNVITFNVSGLAITGDVKAKLIVYDTAHTNGQALIDPHHHNVVFKFVNA